MIFIITEKAMQVKTECVSHAVAGLRVCRHQALSNAMGPIVTGCAERSSQTITEIAGLPCK
jgi:hypothetical protein